MPIGVYRQVKPPLRGEGVGSDPEDPGTERGGRPRGASKRGRDLGGPRVASVFAPDCSRINRPPRGETPLPLLTEHPWLLSAPRTTMDHANSRRRHPRSIRSAGVSWLSGDGGGGSRTACVFGSVPGSPVASASGAPARTAFSSSFPSWGSPSAGPPRHRVSHPFDPGDLLGQRERPPRSGPGHSRLVPDSDPRRGGAVLGVLGFLLRVRMQGHGTPGIIHALATRNGVISLRKEYPGTASGILTVSCGDPWPGRPHGRVRVALSSWVGRRLRLEPQHLRILVCSAAAAGLAAAYNSPSAPPCSPWRS